MPLALVHWKHAHVDTSAVDVERSWLGFEVRTRFGQRLMGVLEKTDSPQTVEYKARIVHVPSAGQAYLIAVYIEAPGETPGFDEAATLVTGDFEIALP